MMVNKIFIYGLVIYGKGQLLFYCLCWSYPCYDGICFVHYGNYHPELRQGKWVPVVDVLLGNVDIEAMLAYLRPCLFSDKADYATVFNSAAFGRCLKRCD